MIAIPFETIASIDEVKKFFNWLFFDAHVIFHPDNRFEVYTDRQGNPSFTESECKQLNHLMDQCFAVCSDEGVQIYGIGGEEHFWEKN